MKAVIQQLIAEGRTDEALQKLADLHNDGILLLSRYNAGKKQYNNGLIDFNDWSRAQAQINYAALELLKSLPNDGPAPATNDPAPVATNNSNAANNRKKVFISYNHKDKDACDKVKAFLENAGFEVNIDREKMEAGQSIADFIKSNIKSNGYIVSLVSENSLKSGWVAMESTASLFAEWIADKHFIPVALDSNWSSSEFFIEALTYINDSVKQKKADIKKAEKLGARAPQLESQIERLLDLRDNLGKILEKLQSVLTVSIADGGFDSGMQQVVKVISK